MRREYVGGGGRSRQDVCDWNPESPLLRAKLGAGRIPSRPSGGTAPLLITLRVLSSNSGGFKPNPVVGNPWAFALVFKCGAVYAQRGASRRPGGGKKLVTLRRQLDGDVYVINQFDVWIIVAIFYDVTWRDVRDRANEFS